MNKIKTLALSTSLLATTTLPIVTISCGNTEKDKED